ncbi:NTP transferase domain-containing protein [Candidatus Fermentibacteria bacterium]|nr:NTP transferase domain-containing protein [Candidatus Fermentibacteria bacterium]
MTSAVVLAAGQGKRMRSNLAKVAHPVLGRPMVLRVLDAARSAGVDRAITVVGHGRDQVIEILRSIDAEWVVQDPQLGTAHAVQVGLESLDEVQDLVVLLGDVPLIDPRTIDRLLEARRREKAAVTVLTAFPPDPSGYGRIVRTGDGDRISGIVEERDATAEQREIGEINTGTMAFDGQVLPELLEALDNDNAQGEYYLTDTISEAVRRKLTVVARRAESWREVAGINDQVQLAGATDYLRRSVLRGLMLSGVTVRDPDTVWIEDGVEVGGGCAVGRLCRLSGSTVVGEGCIIGDGCVLVDSVIPPGSEVKPFTVLEGARL